MIFEAGSALKTIQDNAFRWCINLAKITFPEGLEKIRSEAFSSSELENIEFPASLRTIAQASFAECRSLKVVKFGEGLEVLGTDEYDDDGDTFPGVFEESTIENIELPSTLKRIEYSVFQDCENLKSIMLPDSLEFIGEECFQWSGLQTIQVPEVGVRMGDNAFNNCPVKESLIFHEGRVFPKDQ